MCGVSFRSASIPTLSGPAAEPFLCDFSSVMNSKQITLVIYCGELGTPDDIHGPARQWAVDLPRFIQVYVAPSGFLGIAAAEFLEPLVQSASN